MENWEQQTLINELAQGMELAKQLRSHVGPSSTTETREYLVQKILSSYDKALLILNWSESSSNGQGRWPQLNVAANLLPESPSSFDGSPHSDASDKGFKHQPQQPEHVNDVSKKRKTQPKWTDHVRIYTENGLEGPHDDGYSWRKYGQKDILGAKYPRSYYRCTYRNIKHCGATKQVQRSDEDPTVFEITYKGKHTCVPECDQNMVPIQQDEEVQRHNNNSNGPKQSHADDILLHLENTLKVNTEDMSNKEMTRHLPSGSTARTMNANYSAADFDGSLMQLSSATSGSNNLPVSPFHQNSSFGAGFGTLCCSESDRSDMFSSNASTTNSPYLDLDFTLDPANPDLTFPFSVPGFFS
uniref:WRKY domain-containing protein n=1 Tax=Kalanchoe fedtschenkoi TaxID=63787 RepID=A0A7N0VKC8_KALFE